MNVDAGVGVVLGEEVTSGGDTDGRVTTMVAGGPLQGGLRRRRERLADGTGVHAAIPAAVDDTDDDEADDEADDALFDAAPEVGPALALSSPGLMIDGTARKVRRRTKRDRPRSKTIAMKRVTRAELAAGALLYPVVEDVERPRTRAQCMEEARPCPWVSCKHHLYLDINPETGSIKINFPDLEPWEMKHTCSLDVAESGALTLEEIGLITNLTRERIRQVEVRGLMKLKVRREIR